MHRGNRYDLSEVFKEILLVAKGVEVGQCPPPARRLKTKFAKHDKVHREYAKTCNQNCGSCAVKFIGWAIRRSEEAGDLFENLMEAQIASSRAQMCSSAAMLALKAPEDVTGMFAEAVLQSWKFSGIPFNEKTDPVSIYISALKYLVKHGPILEPDEIEVHIIIEGADRRLQAVGVYPEPIGAGAVSSDKIN